MRRNWIKRAVLGALALAAIATFTPSAVEMTGAAWRSATVSAPAAPIPALLLTEVEHKFLGDEWSDRISTDTFWRSRPRAPSAPNPAATGRGRSNLQGPQPEPGWFITPQQQSPFWDPDSARFNQTGPRTAPKFTTGYRTVCVRTCDGSFFPISHGTSQAHFSRDQTTCSNACPGARLFYYKASGEDPDDMVDTSGQPYSKMPNANLFRTQYVESCKCKPHPWEQQAVERHRIYALEDQKRKGNRAVVAELEVLKSKLQRERTGATGRGRSSERSRRPSNGDRDETRKATAQTTAEAAAAPRSDATRGQGGDRPLSQVAPVQTAAAPPQTSTASSAPYSPIAAAATAAGPAPVSQAAAPPAVSYAAHTPPGSAANPAFSTENPYQIQPEAMPAPEAIIAVPFEQLPGLTPDPEAAPVIQGKRRTGKNTTARINGASHQAQATPPPVWRIERSSSWPRSVFNQ